MIAILLGLLQAAAPPMTPSAPQSAPPPAALSDTIVVTGARLSDLRTAAEACAKAACPPRQDVIASVRYAEAQFRQGDYRGARKTLWAADARTRGHGREEPIAISQLQVARATVAEHLGDQDEARRATFSSAAVLRDALGDGDIDTLTADLRTADFDAQRGNLRDAKVEYRAVARRGRAAGHGVVAGVADLRHAAVLHAERSDSEARALLAPLLAGEVPALTTAAQAMAARIARDSGDRSAIDRLVAAVAAAPPGPGGPQLLYAPRVAERADPADRDAFDLTSPGEARGSDVFNLVWVDVGFRIGPDGRVETPEILRGSRAQNWAKPVLEAIAGRRYTPSPGPAGGDYRIERWTLTADWTTPKGSLIRRRAGMTHFQQLDLTGEAPAAARSGGR